MTVNDVDKVMCQTHYFPGLFSLLLILQVGVKNKQYTRAQYGSWMLYWMPPDE
jgi:hypothetical protein